MKYHAQLHGVPLERPTVSFSENPKTLEEWAKSVLSSFAPSKFPDANVVVSQLVEKPLCQYRRASEETTELKHENYITPKASANA